ncbi:heavy-metal-associated domain-containing protein [Pasteurella oralis]|uniref:Heavy-metal-associated domain-containing protein n=1 Tax=Pasteurella oralis TaxID=1071947 RepID=A0ABW4NX73_9PAST|nr:heavy-metal-associated domain-containing protein [Pasteurella oralis]MDO5054617.1 heavy-metal-associated domain-containing protein [Pasteurella oralis]
MQKVTLRIEGMHCGGCVKSVTRILQEFDGVAIANVNLEAANAEVTFDHTKVSVADLIDAVENAGFDAQQA